ncbi:MAG: Fur family transcriptional regulator [Acidimicrobiia bacterium]
MHITADDLIAVLRSEDLRITDSRRLVCEVIAQRHSEHLTAAGIYEIVQSDTDRDIDRATVYRTLDALEAAGAIKHGHIGHGPTVYHLAEDADHQHLVCSKCGRTVAVDRSDIETLLTAIEAKTGFVPDVEHFALSGLCEDCADQV